MEVQDGKFSYPCYSIISSSSLSFIFPKVMVQVFLNCAKFHTLSAKCWQEYQEVFVNLVPVLSAGKENPGESQETLQRTETAAF